MFHVKLKELRKSFKVKSAFTIIEVVVVIALVSVMSLVVVPSFKGYTQSAEADRAEAELMSAYVAVEDAIEEYQDIRILVNENGSAKATLINEITSKTNLNKNSVDKYKYGITSDERLAIHYENGDSTLIFDGMEFKKVKTIDKEEIKILTNENKNKVVDLSGGKVPEVIPPEWFKFDTSTGTLTGLTNIGIKYFDGDVVIPETINGVSVVNVDNEAFHNLKVNTVIIPDTVETIGDKAFYNNNLVRVFIPESVREMGASAFSENGSHSGSNSINDTKPKPLGAGPDFTWRGVWQIYGVVWDQVKILHTTIESLDENQTVTIDYSELGIFSEATVDIGNVEVISVDPDNKKVTVKLTGGQGELKVISGSLVERDEKYVTNQSNQNYNQDGYSGVLARYLHSGKLTEGATKYISSHTSSKYNQDGYTGSLTRFLVSGDESQASSKTVTDRQVDSYEYSTYRYERTGSYYPEESKYVSGQTSSSYNSGGYSGSLSRYVYDTNRTSYPSRYISGHGSSYYSSGGYSGSLSAHTTTSSGACKNVTGQTSSSYNSGGYSGSLSRYVHSGSQTPRATRTETSSCRWFENQRKTDAPNNRGNYYTYRTVNNCPGSISYNSGGFSGTLRRGGSSRINTEYGSHATRTHYYRYSYSGTVTRPASDTRVYRYSGRVCQPDIRTTTYRGYVYRPDDVYNIYRYRGTVYKPGYNTYSYSWNHYNNSTSNLSTSHSISYNSDGFSGTLNKTNTSRETTSYPFPSASVGSTHTRYRYTTYQNYSGTVTKPYSDTRVYRYRGNVSRPQSDTRVYRYRGNVIRPYSDNRVWDTFYRYSITIK